MFCADEGLPGSPDLDGESYSPVHSSHLTLPVSFFPAFSSFVSTDFVGAFTI